MAATKLPDDALLDDLCTRFILNVPAEDLASFEKLMFLVEQAHWFYLDFCRDQDLTLRSLGLKDFTALLFRRCPGLSPYAHLCSDILARFTAYKQGVPVMGAVLLDPSMRKCLLVRGYSQQASWGFPRGKVAKGESDASCAIREVREETGYDIASRLVAEDCIEMHIKEQRTKLFIITNVDEGTSFAPLVRGEIGGFAWHVIADLPATKQSSLLTFNTPEGARHKFFNVWPYMKQLKHWIKQNKRRKPAAAQQQLQPATSQPADVVVTASPALQAEQTSPFANAQPSEPQSAAQGSDERRAEAAAPLTVAHADTLEPKPAATAHVASVGQPGQLWLHFRLDKHAVMRALDDGLNMAPTSAALVMA